MNFRVATIHDLPRIVEIYNSTVASRMATADLEPVSVESKVAWFNAHTPHKHPLWVVENENKAIIGWVSLQAFHERKAYAYTQEVSIYLAEEYRGKCLGESILQEATSKAKELGIKTLVGLIFAHNTPSIRLFTKLGFEEWGLMPNVATLDGVDRGLAILGKRINV